MPVRVFSEEEKTTLKETMLEAGFPLLKEYGMTHMSITKIATAAGIGKSTFYNFFPSKEAFVFEMIGHLRKKMWRRLDVILDGREKMTKEEASEFIRKIVFSEESIYPYLNQEDEAKLFSAFPEKMKADKGKERSVMDFLLSKIEHVKSNPDYEVIANLVKIIVMAAEGREELHQDAYVRTQELLFQLLFEQVFEA